MWRPNKWPGASTIQLIPAWKNNAGFSRGGRDANGEKVQMWGYLVTGAKAVGREANWPLPKMLPDLWG